MSKSRISMQALEQRLRACFSEETSRLQPPADLWSKVHARLEAQPARSRSASLWQGLFSPWHWRPLPALAIPVALLVIVFATWLLMAAPWRAPRLVSTTGPAGAPLLLTVLDPTDGSTVSARSVAVHGKTHPEATVLINGELADVDPSGVFSLRVPLNEGPNTLEIAAIGAEDLVTRQLNVTGASGAAPGVAATSAPAARLFVTIQDPPNGSVVSTRSVPIHGRTHPEATVLINGKLADVDPSGVFSLRVPLEEGPNALEVTAIGPEDVVVQQLNVTSASGATREVSGISAPADKLFVTVMDPPDGSIVTTRSLTIRGRTKADALVLANDKMANVGADGTFSLKVTLDEGPNAFGITAMDDRGLVETVLAVVFEPSGAANP